MNLGILLDFGQFTLTIVDEYHLVGDYQQTPIAVVELLGCWDELIKNWS